MSVEILSTVAQLYENRIRKGNKWQTLKVTQGHQKLRYSIDHIPLPNTVSNNVSILQNLQDITTFTVYMTACDLEKSFIFDMIVEMTGHVHFMIHV